MDTLSIITIVAVTIGMAIVAVGIMYAAKTSVESSHTK